jgi:hypothetical protein
MKKSLMVVRLYDDTVIWAKDWRFESSFLIVKNAKTVHKKNNPVYIEDETKISNDAIRVWFKVLHGGKPKEDVRVGPHKPKNTPAG